MAYVLCLRVSPLFERTYRDILITSRPILLLVDYILLPLSALFPDLFSNRYSPTFLLLLHIQMRLLGPSVAFRHSSSCSIHLRWAVLCISGCTCSLLAVRHSNRYSSRPQTVCTVNVFVSGCRCCIFFRWSGCRSR